MKSLYNPISTVVFCKLMRSGLQNQIVDDSDFKPSKFDRRFQSDLDSNDETVSSTALRAQIKKLCIVYGVKSLKQIVEFLNSTVSIWSHHKFNFSLIFTLSVAMFSHYLLISMTLCLILIDVEYSRSDRHTAIWGFCHNMYN